MVSGMGREGLEPNTHRWLHDPKVPGNLWGTPASIREPDGLQAITGSGLTTWGAKLLPESDPLLLCQIDANHCSHVPPD